MLERRRMAAGSLRAAADRAARARSMAVEGAAAWLAAGCARVIDGRSHGIDLRVASPLLGLTFLRVPPLLAAAALKQQGEPSQPPLSHHRCSSSSRSPRKRPLKNATSHCQVHSSPPPPPVPDSAPPPPATPSSAAPTTEPDTHSTRKSPPPVMRRSDKSAGIASQAAGHSLAPLPADELLAPLGRRSRAAACVALTSATASVVATATVYALSMRAPESGRGWRLRNAWSASTRALPPSKLAACKLPPLVTSLRWLASAAAAAAVAVVAAAISLSAASS